MEWDIITPRKSMFPGNTLIITFELTADFQVYLLDISNIFLSKSLKVPLLF